MLVASFETRAMGRFLDVGWYDLSLEENIGLATTMPYRLRLQRGLSVVVNPMLLMVGFLIFFFFSLHNST